MELPKTYTDKNDTGCCAVPNVDEWDNKEVVFEDKRFIRMHTRSFLYMPLNMSKVMTEIQRTAEDAGAAMVPNEAMTLSRDVSPWKAEHLYAVTKEVGGADNVVLSGTYITKVFEGPFKNIRNWYNSLQTYVTSQGKIPGDTYFFYTTCPKCAKHYGKNYVIGMTSVA
ncbi:hypothetical protein IPL85_04950 [Candidatus Saccharibacteria bacterium]|nr:MAG: hypothetical protein IPL85_04950 [Candidatus Saccharibacteria bacterium]